MLADQTSKCTCPGCLYATPCVANSRPLTAEEIALVLMTPEELVRWVDAKTKEQKMSDRQKPTTNCPACEAQDGDPCEGGPEECLSAYESALDAGIPSSVILGKSKLTDHFTKAYIDAQCLSDSDGEE